jgi:hypothetical protein
MAKQNHVARIPRKQLRLSNNNFHDILLFSMLLQKGTLYLSYLSAEIPIGNSFIYTANSQ